MGCACFHVLAFSTVLIQVANAIPQPVTVGSQDPSIGYYPSGSWAYVNATDGFSKVGGFSVFMFVLHNSYEAKVRWTTPGKAFQRSDGGNASISFDNGPATVFDYYNGTSNGSDGPVLVYSTDSLSPEQHTVSIKNLVDSRGTLYMGYGQLNVDHFFIIPVSPGATTIESSTSSTSPTAKPGGSSNHVGAIAGGVGGGVAGLALISLALFLFLRRGRRRAVLHLSCPKIPGATPEYWNTPSPSSAPPIGRLYDPNDSRTYPPPLTQSLHADPTPEL
ncbi:hypothetical protein BS47DRAFT_1345224 [Hydnum rufescens UP504]|uniref:Uncharacterized protein n=1 Tax=Hydnum rufescens UP504 TaxID=1448309 RepID=A0A9P6DWD3_9AGAM|nr:hypothetical protein BS47DRAFT_1345224 [Hydnum rufescens UP504]